jgi:hypothetical protein
VVDLNKIKAKAGISGPPAEQKLDPPAESPHSSVSIGKRRFWFDENVPLATSVEESSQPAEGPPDSDEEPAAKGEQRASKGPAKGEPKGQQRVSKGPAKGEQEVPDFTSKGEQKASKRLAKGEPKGEQEKTQRVSKWLANGEQEKALAGAFGKLVGLQRKILLIVYESMQGRGDNLTEPMSSTLLAESVLADRLTTKDALRRLRVKGILSHGEVKNGKGGWVRYAVPPIIRAEIFAWQRVSKGLAKGEPKGEQNPSSSSSYIDSNLTPTTTAESETRVRAKDVWTPEDLDYSMLADIGFGRSQALQLRSLGLSFDVVQSSLVYFDFELRYTKSGKTIQAPLGLLMKRLRQNGCWEAPEEYTRRHEHFRSVFDERERHLQESKRQGATAAESSSSCPEVAEDQP